MIQYDYSKPIESYEKAGIFSRIVSFLFPVIGLFLYLYYDEGKPVKSKTCGKCAGIGIVFQIVAYYLIEYAIKAWFKNFIYTHLGI